MYIYLLNKELRVLLILSLVWAKDLSFWNIFPLLSVKLSVIDYIKGDLRCLTILCLF